MKKQSLRDKLDEQSTDEKQVMVKSEGLTSAEAEELLEKFGRNELPENKIPLWYVFISLLWQPMPIMIWIAIIIEAGIQDWLDCGILLFIQFANAGIAFYETTKAGHAVEALKASLKPEATVKRDGKMRTMDAALLVPGDLVLLGSGSAVPADCRVNAGKIEVDQSQLTGEAEPVTKSDGNAVMMGTTVVKGEVEGTVEFTGPNTFFGKTAALLTDENELSNLQMTLVDIMIVLVTISVSLCSIVFIYLLTEISFEETISYVVVLLVASIPLAIEIVTTTTLALGSKELSARGAIVTRLASIENMAGMAILCSDKTGTLTMNKMMIQQETPIFQEGETHDSVLRYAAMAARWMEPPRDALDTMVLTAADLESLGNIEQLDFMPFDPAVKRTEGTLRDKGSGETFKTTKGMPKIIVKLLDDATESAVAAQVIAQEAALGARGIRCIAVAKTDASGSWKMLGLLTFLDPPRPDTKQTIDDARAYGVMVKMITGDSQVIAKETARVLELGSDIRDNEGLPELDPETKKAPADLAEKFGDMCLHADGFAQVYPEHKYLIVECLRRMGYKVGMTGDGVNDAPALKRADIGVAVEGSTDAARAAADLVLTEPGLSTIVDGIIISRCIFERIRSFFTYRIAATLQLILFFFIAVFAFTPSDFTPNDDDIGEWPVYFHLPVLLLMLITVLNDFSLISVGYDTVTASREPQVWNLRVLFFIGGVMGSVACLSSLLLLWALLTSSYDNSLLRYLGIGEISYGKITTAIYLQVSIVDFLGLFNARTKDQFFFSSFPSPVLLGAGIFSMTLSTILACVWPNSYLDDVKIEGLLLSEPYGLVGWVWLYCILSWLMQDVCKVLAYKFLRAFNIFGINNTGGVPPELIYAKLTTPTPAAEEEEAHQPHSQQQPLLQQQQQQLL